jgi:hypothetical protein
MISNIHNVQGDVGIVQLLSVAMDMSDSDTVSYIITHYEQAILNAVEDGEGLIAAIQRVLDEETVH